MKRFIFFCIVFFLNISTLCYSQRMITVCVSDENNEPVIGVRITQSDGNTTQTDEFGVSEIVMPADSDCVTIALSHDLFLDKSIKIYQDEDTVPVRMIEIVNELDKVTVSAHRYGRFSNYSSQNIVYPTEDLVANANAFGDLLSGLVNTPGVQTNADDGRLMIQGGGPDESVYYIDGLILFNPYVESINVGNRFKFGKQLFEGTIMQSGGWSASYGNALSGIVQLNTASNDRVKALTAYLSQSNVGIEGQMSTGNTVLTGELSYYNMRPYYDMIHSNAHWQRDYQEMTSDLSVMNRIGHKGQIKTILHYHHTTGEFTVPYIGYQWHYDKTEDDCLANLAIDLDIADDWNLYAGANIAYLSQNSISRFANGDSSHLSKTNSHIKAELTRHGTSVNHRLGVENVISIMNEHYFLNGDTTCQYRNNLLSAYYEASLDCVKNLDVNLGVRYEYSTLLNQSNLAPRLNICYHMGALGSLSLSSGLYNMMPQEDLLRIDRNLKFRQSINNTLTYQYRNNDFMIQAEGYYKKYHRLETYNLSGRWLFNDIDNRGDGDVKGVNVFLQGTAFQMLQYRVNYSYTDANLQMGSMNKASMPQYLSKNRLTLSANTYVPWIKSFVAASWFIDDGSTFYRYSNVDDSHHSPCRHQLDLGLYIMPYKDFQVYFSCQNVYGRKNVYGYRYSVSNPELREPIYTLDPRIYWVEFSITFINKKDRMKYLRKRLEDRFM